MPEFFLELFSEEIPARMQTRAADDLSRLLSEALVALKPTDATAFSGPRRLAIVATIDAAVAESRVSERGPRVSAPEQALAGFLRKHGATKDMLTQDGEFWVLDRIGPGASAAELIAKAVPALIRRFPWPKSMRWGGTSTLTWVRPLRRIVCLLDGAVVPFDLVSGTDDGHGLVASNQSEGHRFLSPGAFTVTSAAQWPRELRARHVIVDAAERRALVAEGIEKLAAERQCTVAEDPGLLDEVAGLVEWPVPLLGRIDDAFMDLPAEVMQVSMRVNQRYFALRNGDGSPAPYFAFASNIAATDGGAAIIAGNERVLRARFSDARHFWDLDRTRTLESRVAALDAITFHVKLGSQGQRVKRIVVLAGQIAPLVGAVPDEAKLAALLCKADLSTGMVGEFPELQGVIGSYYALADGKPMSVVKAIRDHYSPKGIMDSVPSEPTTIAVALADKIDIISCFFQENMAPTGSGDPFALRRAALGIIRIMKNNKIFIDLGPHIKDSITMLLTKYDWKNTNITMIEFDIDNFLVDRLKFLLKSEGVDHGILNALIDEDSGGYTDRLTRLLSRTNALTTMLNTTVGIDLLKVAKRNTNLLRIEAKKDGPYEDVVSDQLLMEPIEQNLARCLDRVDRAVADAMRKGDFASALSALVQLAGPLNAFLDNVRVNGVPSELRLNRLCLMSMIGATMDRVADFSKIDG